MGLRATALEALGRGNEGAVQGCLAEFAQCLSVAVMHGLRRHVADARVPVRRVVPGEERLAVRAGVYDAAEARGEVRSVFHRLERDSEYGLSSETWGQLWLLATLKLPRLADTCVLEKRSPLHDSTGLGHGPILHPCTTDQAARPVLDVVITSASPSITTLSCTVQTVDSVTRHFSRRTSLTVTVAWTVSPGRTGALKRRFWPR